MKKILFSVIGLLSLVAISRPLWAQTACGGMIQYSNDCASNHRNWHISCCPDSSYRVQGVAYTDIKDKDAVDAISAVCRKAGASESIWMTSSDFQKQPKKFECSNEEIMVGIYSKDRMADDGKSDTLDGLTVFCQKSGSDALRKVSNVDIEGGREGRQQTVLPPKTVVGIASKEKEKGTSDEKDCVTIVTKD